MSDYRAAFQAWLNSSIGTTTADTAIAAEIASTDYSDDYRRLYAAARADGLSEADARRQAMEDVEALATAAYVHNARRR